MFDIQIVKLSMYVSPGCNKSSFAPSCLTIVKATIMYLFLNRSYHDKYENLCYVSIIVIFVLVLLVFI